MRLIELVPAGYRAFALILALTLLAGLSASAAWKVQDWRYGQQLVSKDLLVASDDNQELQVVVRELEQQKAERSALEAQLKADEEAHYKELKREQDARKVLRDRIATGELRLSVLLASGSPGINSGGQVSAATGAGGVVHGATRAELEPAHAQRIIGITDDGDDGLRALAACQAYAKKVSAKKASDG